MTKSIKVFVKGFIIGGAALLPCVGCGTAAIALGVYERLVYSIASFRNNPRRNALFLALLLPGVLAGIFFLAGPLFFLLDRVGFFLAYFFIGLILGSLPVILGKAEGDFRFGNFLWILSGFILTAVIYIIPERQTGIGNNGFLLMIFGSLLAFTLLTPGLSLSFGLLVLGIYRDFLRAVSEFDIAFLFPLTFGLVVGCVIFAKGIKFLIIRYKDALFMIILGVMICSAFNIFPGLPLRNGLPVAAAIFVAGFLTTYLTNKEPR